GDLVTGVQTCALPISQKDLHRALRRVRHQQVISPIAVEIAAQHSGGRCARGCGGGRGLKQRAVPVEYINYLTGFTRDTAAAGEEIGRASCREGVQNTK